MQRETVEGYRLASQQQRLWLLQRQSNAYHSQCAILIEGAPDARVLRAALDMLVSRQDILRTAFVCLPGLKIPMQVLLDECAPAWREQDLTALDAEEQSIAVERQFQQELQSDFDFEHAPLLRVHLLTLSHAKQILLLSLPAMCADAQTLCNVAGELSRCYQSCLLGQEVQDEPVSFIQFSEWQHELMELEESAEGRAYWRAQVETEIAPPGLPWERRELRSMEFQPRSYALTVEPEMLGRINSLLEQYETSLDVFLLSCWQVLLWHLTRQDEFRVFVQGDGRVYEEMREAFGLYARWLPLHCQLTERETFKEILERTGKTLHSALEWQEYFSWNAAMEHAPAEMSGRAHEAVAFEFLTLPASQTAGHARFSIGKLHSCTDRFKLKLSGTQNGDALTLEFHYDTAFYTDDAARRTAEQFSALLGSITSEPENSIVELEALSYEERLQVLVEWNRTELARPAEQLLHKLFEAQAARKPDALAVVFEERRLTFDELNRSSNRLAHHLMSLGIEAESRVALCMRRAPELLVGLLGILKAGGAYVPLDPEQPGQRLQFMLRDSQARVLLTQECLAQTLPAHDAGVVCLDAVDKALREASDDNPAANVSPDNLAYVIYTSGSTGMPKAAMIEHRSVANLAAALREAVFNDTDSPLRVSLNAPLSFDSSVKQVLQLFEGHGLYIPADEVRRDGDALLSFIEHNGLQVLDCTPSQLKLLLEAGLLQNRNLDLRRVLIGGEAIDEAVWATLAKTTGIEFYNVYGPTECTVDATSFRINAANEQATIGRPLGNMQLYILNKRLKPVPIGVSGELHIAGHGVGRGYLGQPALTAEKFIPHPFGGESGARIYKTGDLVRYLPDGNIEFLGRVDHQVKIRGFRIELGEIEAALLQHASVRETVVLVREDVPGNPRLFAYFKQHDGASSPPSGSELRNFLKERLPEYMLPASFVMLEEWPLTPNGKIDRQSLLTCEQPAAEFESAFETEYTPTQEVLSGIWSQVLEVKQIGLNDNFFDMGGHSLLAMQLISKVREAFQVELALRSLFEAPTVGGLSEHVEQALRAGVGIESPPILPVPRDGAALPLSYAQKRLWFLHQLEPESPAYNIPAAMRLTGSLDVAILEQTLSEVVRRHEVLRTSFATIDDEPVQIVAPARAWRLPIHDLTETTQAERDIEAQRLADEEAQLPFDIAHAPLLRVRLLRLAATEHVVLFTMHHIISDGWSMGILIKEVTMLYDAYTSGLSSPLPELALQYADFAVWQRNWLQGEVIESHLNYWRQQLGGPLPVLEIPALRPRPPVPSSKGAVENLPLSHELSDALKALSRREDVTLFMTTLAAFKALLYRSTGQPDVIVGCGIANRNHAEIENLIGFFVNMLVLRTPLSGEMSFSELLGRVREVALGAYVHQELPFEHLVEDLKPERDPARTPLFQVAFFFQNTPRKALELPELRLSAMGSDNKAAKFDLTLVMSDNGHQLIPTIEYKTDLFEAPEIVRLLTRLQSLLEHVVAQPDQPLSSIPLLGEAETEGFVPEDFPDAELSQADFENLLLELNQD